MGHGRSFIFLNTENVKSTKHTYCTTSLHMALVKLVFMTDGFIFISLLVTRVLILTYETLMYLLIFTPPSLLPHFSPPLLSLSSLSGSWLLIRGNTCCISQSSVQQYSNSLCPSISQTHTTCAWLIQLQAHVSETITTAQMFHRPFV